MNNSWQGGNWNLYPLISASMPFQLAFDEVMLKHYLQSYEKIPAPMLRFYLSDKPWVSLGYSRRGFKRSYGSAHASPEKFRYVRDLPVCRRITGGGRVVHGNDIIFSVIAHKESEPSFGSVRLSYLKIHEAVKLAFENLGLAPRFYRCDEPLPKGEDCFLYPIATDLAIGKKKMAGGAQKRTHGVMLHQESIKLPGEVDAFRMMDELRRALTEIFHLNLCDTPLNPEWMHEAKSLSKLKYETNSFQEDEDLASESREDAVSVSSEWEP